MSKLRLVLGGRPRLVGFLAAASLHAVGHALVAVVGGGLALALSGRFGTLAAPMASPDTNGGVLHGLGGRWLRGVSPGDQALFLAAAGLSVVLVKAAAGTYATYVQAGVAGEVGGSLRLQLLDAILAVHGLHRPRQDDHGATLPAPSVSADPSGRAAGRDDLRGTHAVAALTDRVREVETGLEQGFLGGARALAQIVPVVVLLVVLSPSMALVAGFVLAPFGWLLGRVRRGYRRATQRGARERAELLESADETVRHAELWVTYGAQAKARAATRKLGDALARGSARLQARAAASSGANEVLGALALVLAIAASRAGWLGAALGGERLLLFAVVFFLAYRPLRELAEARLALARAQGAYDDLGAFTDAADVVPAGSTLPATVRESGWPLADLELRDVRLARGRCAPLSLRAVAGSIVVIAGETGMGKTTLLRTLLGLDAALGGDILFAGSAIGDASAGPASRPFAWVPQDAPLLGDTLAANVGLGVLDAVDVPSAARVDPRELLESLGAAHLVSALGDARLGGSGGGRAVSGGERQWIALARALATRQPVLLLDEPTNGLDAASQTRVLKAISLLRGQRTVILVTHRPEPLAIADLVVRLDAADVTMAAAIASKAA